MTDDAPGFLNGFRFELREPPPPMTLAEIGALMARVEAGKKRIACASDMFEQVRDAVYGTGYGICYKVIECSWMDDGQVVVMPSESEYEAETRALGQRMMDEYVEGLERERRADAALNNYRHLYGATIHQPPPFVPIIAGI